MTYSVVDHKSGKGYAIHYSGPCKPAWLKGDTFDRIKSKDDALLHASVLNMFEHRYLRAQSKRKASKQSTSQQ